MKRKQRTKTSNKFHLWENIQRQPTTKKKRQIRKNVNLIKIKVHELHTKWHLDVERSQFVLWLFFFSFVHLVGSFYSIMFSSPTQIFDGVNREHCDFVTCARCVPCVHMTVYMRVYICDYVSDQQKSIQPEMRKCLSMQ